MHLSSKQKNNYRIYWVMSFPFTDGVEVPGEIGCGIRDKVLVSLWQIDLEVFVV